MKTGCPLKVCKFDPPEPGEDWLRIIARCLLLAMVFLVAWSVLVWIST